MRLAANISQLWAELPLLDRFDAAAEAGFAGVELMQPYDIAVPEMRNAVLRNSLRFVSLAAPGPNYTGGARGFAAVPGSEARFVYDMRRAVRYAEALGAAFIQVLPGDTDAPEARATLISNLKQAVHTLPSGLTLTLKPLSADHVARKVLTSYAAALDIVMEVGADRLGLQFDSFHAQMITGDAAQCFADYAPVIRHVQIADAPSQGAPGTGTVDFGALLSAIGASGYDGWISASYLSKDRTDSELSWMQSF